MATYASLTAEQKELIGAHERNFRAWVGGLGRLLVQARALDAHYDANDGPGSIIATLDVGERIPNTGGLPGAQSLVDTDWNALIAGFGVFLTTYDSMATRKRIAQAAGPLAGLE